MAMASEKITGIIKSIESGQARLGLSLASSLSLEDWIKIGAAIGKRRSDTQWMIADWWARGGEYGSRKRESQKGLLGQLSMSTLMQYGTVSRNVSPKIRTDRLSFAHHRCVIGLSEAGQRIWLNRAIEQRLQVAALRNAIAEWEADNGGKAVKPTRATPQGNTRVATHSDRVADFQRALRMLARRYGVAELVIVSPTEWRLDIKTETVAVPAPVQLALVPAEPLSAA